MRSCLAIVNPLAGGGRALRAWAAAEPALAALGARVGVARTEWPGHAEALARDAAEDGGWDMVLAVGGDGTVNEVVNGLLGWGGVRAGAAGVPGADDGPAGVLDGVGVPGPAVTPRPDERSADAGDSRIPLLGVIPAGSGDDFARQIGAPAGDGAAAARLAATGCVIAVDAGLANGRWFVNGVGWGLDGMVAVAVSAVHRGRGPGMYLRALAGVLPRFEPAHIDLTVDGRTVPGHVTLVAITNGPAYGGGYRICPHARIDDGQLDVCVADAMGPLRALWLLPKVRRGRHLGQRKVWYARGRHVTLVSRVPRPAHADGEVLGAAVTRLDVTLAAGGLRVVGTMAAAAAGPVQSRFTGSQA